MRTAAMSNFYPQHPDSVSHIAEAQRTFVEWMNDVASYLDISTLEKIEVMVSFPTEKFISKLKCCI